MAGKAFILRLRPSYEDHLNDALKNNVILIGWARGGILLDEQLSRFEIREKIQNTYYSDEPTLQRAGQATTHLWRFFHEMGIGDLVVVPHNQHCFIAKITGKAILIPALGKDGGLYARQVNWLNAKKATPKSHLPQSIQRRIRSLRETSLDISNCHSELQKFISTMSVTGEDWTQFELDLVVSTYAEMLHKELAGEGFNKSAYRRSVMAITGRNKGSVEFKNQNISAVLDEVGIPWIKGYKPRFRYQGSLAETVANNVDLMNLAQFQNWPMAHDTVQTQLPKSASKVFVAPPKGGVTTNTPQATKRLVVKIDQAQRDARNRDLGTSGEKFVFDIEKARLRNYPKLARRVTWVSREQGDGLGYDIASFDTDGSPLFIEVKTTNGEQRTPFYLSANEIAVSKQLGLAYRIYRVFDFARTPRIFRLQTPLDEFVTLQPIIFRAHLN